ncbi:MAG: DHH family phosphoesterase [Coraliomargarita sp.]
MTDEKFFPEQSALFAEAINRLQGKKVAVIGHVRPDGDCIGSIVAVTRLLNSMGIEAVGLNRDEVPENLKPFVGDTPLMLAGDFTPDGHVAVSVDCADYKRVGERLNELFPDVALNIDHHISNKNYGQTNLVIATACATAEILAGFFLDNGYAFDPVIAQNLYVGIATDTGQFRFPSTTPATFEIARQLCEHGAHPAEAAFELYENESFAKIKLLQHFLATLRMEFDERVCIGLIDDGVYDACGASIDDSEGLVDYARSIKGVDIGVLLENRSGSLKGSLRAKDPAFRVDQIAKLFSGGGHACAAGLNVENSSIEEFLPQLVEAIGKQLDAVNA